MATLVNPGVIDLGDPDEQRLHDAEHAALTAEELLAEAEEEAQFPTLSDEDAQFIDQLVLRTIVFCEKLADMELRPYQRDLAYRMIESIILADGDEMTALWSRQSGKSETISVVISGIMVLFPRLAFVYEKLARFKKGVWIGVFAPTDEQSGFIYNKVFQRLTGAHGKAFLQDPEIDEEAKGTTKVMRLKSGSFIKRQTANAKANIEGETLHMAIVDKAQDVDDTKYRKSISPMLASTGGTTVAIGTPGFHKGFFYELIQFNKRRALEHRRARHVEHHFVVDPYHDWHLTQETLHRHIRKKWGSVERAQETILWWQVEWAGVEEELTPAGFASLPEPLRKYYQAQYGQGTRVLSHRRTQEDWKTTTNMVVRFEVGNSSSNVASLTLGENVRLREGNTDHANAIVAWSNSSEVRVIHVFGNVAAENCRLVGVTSGANLAVTQRYYEANCIPINERPFWAPVFAYEVEVGINERNKVIKIIDSKYKVEISDAVTRKINE